MAKKKDKFYVVWDGHTPGIYNSWDECNRQVKGYAQAKYKSFDTKTEALNAMAGNYWHYTKKATTPASTSASTSTASIAATKAIANSIAVDAACSGNPGAMEYQGVYTETGTKLFHAGPFEHATNNIGEFLAIVHGLAWLQKEKLDLPIYTDSVNAMLWVKQKKCKTKLVEIAKNRPVFDLIRRAEKWLNENQYTTKIIKWETKIWGEIPADFGRK